MKPIPLHLQYPKMTYEEAKKVTEQVAKDDWCIPC